VSLEVRIDQVDCCLSLKAIGKYRLSDLTDLFDTVKEESEKRGCWNVMLDLTEVMGIIPLLDMLALG
jgi:hypothetical protein